MSDDLLGSLRTWLTDLGLDVDHVSEGRLMTMLAGERKRTIPVMLHLDEQRLHLQSLLVGRPDQHEADVYRYLLRRNETSGDLRFALDGEGAVLIVGSWTREIVDGALLDQVLGSLLDLADGTFNEVLRRGFTDYIEREQKWRETTGQPRNPIS